MQIIKRCFFLSCFSFCLYNLYYLYLDSRSIEYIDNDVRRDSVNFSVCIPVNESYLNRFKDADHVFRFTVDQLVAEICRLRFPNNICENFIFLDSSYIYNYHTCLAIDHRRFDLIFPHLSRVRFKLFIYFDRRSELYFYENVYTHDLNDEFFSLYIKYEETINLPDPYETMCFDYTKFKGDFQTPEMINDRSACFLECLKPTSRKLNYFYSTKDKQPLSVGEDELAFGERSWTMINREFDRKDDGHCENECRKSNCVIRYYSTTKLVFSNLRNYTLQYGTRTITARPVLTRNTFIFESIGLVVLFLNCSLNETSPQLLNKLVHYCFCKYRAMFDRNYRKLKFAILLLSLMLLVGFSLYSIASCLNFTYKNIASIYYSISISPFYLVICLPVQNFIPDQSELSADEELKLIESRSFAEIEHLSNFEKFEHGIVDFYIKYASKRKKVKYTLDRTKVWFMHLNYRLENRSDSKFLYRCYKLDFNIREFRYEMLLSLSELNFVLKFNWFLIYVLSTNQRFSKSNLPIDPELSLYKMTSEKMNACTNYETYDENCNSRASCIDHCINESYLKKYGNLTTSTAVIYKDALSANYSFDKIYFKQIVDLRLEENCTNKFKEVDCIEEIYRTFQQPTKNYADKTIKINLYMIQYRLHHRPDLSYSTLLLNLITLASIFVGLNFHKLLHLFIGVLKKYAFRRLRPGGRLRWLNGTIRRYYANQSNKFKKNLSRYLIFLICQVGFSIHLYLIIDEVLYGELSVRMVPSAFQNIRVPNIIMCFETNQSLIDPHRRLTVGYLNELTKDLNESIFEAISFFDENYQMYELSGEDESNLVQFFYFLDLKCFEIKFEPIANTRYLYLLNEMVFVKIKFNLPAIHRFYATMNRTSLFFVNKKCDTNELNRMERLDLNLTNGTLQDTYFIHQEIFQVNKRQFELRKIIQSFFSHIQSTSSAMWINIAS